MGHYVPEIDYLINTYFILFMVKYKQRSHGTVQSKDIRDAG